MSNLEDQLRAALRREEPPADLADRVLARLNRPVAPSWRDRLAILAHPPRIQWVAIALMVSILLPTATVRYRREREKGERAKQQLLFAMRVAGSRLNRAQKRVLESSRL